MLVEVDDVGFAFNGQAPLFESLSFTVRPGILLGLVGPSGSGKSTLLSLLAGLARPTSGTIRVIDVARTGWIVQQPVGSPRRTARDHIVLPHLLQGMTRAAAEVRADDLLHTFGLDAVGDRQFRELSGGEAQRVAFARATAASFDALLVDEPTAQLDPRTAHTIRDVIRGLVAPDRLVVLATHDAALRDRCDEIIDLGLAT